MSDTGFTYNRFVLGFLFSADFSEVVLIEKKRPEWQAGRFNGVGGRIEEKQDGWNAVNAMRREFREEAGLDIEQERWKHVCTLSDEFSMTFVVFVYAAVYEGEEPMYRAIQQTTDERPIIVRVSGLTTWATLPNVQWLVPMAKNALQGLDHADYFKIGEVYRQPPHPSCTRVPGVPPVG